MRKSSVLMTVCVTLCLSLAAGADVVILKDGTIYEGSIIFKDDQVVIVKTQTTGEVVRVDRKDIIWITQPPQPQPLKEATEEKAAGLPLDDAAAQLADRLKAKSEELDAVVVAVAPFWGPEERVVALDDALAQRITERLRAGGCKVIGPSTIEKLLNALQLERPALGAGPLAGRLANVLGADIAVVGQVTAVGENTVTVKAHLVKAPTGETLAEEQVLIAKDGEVRRLLGEETEPEEKPVESTAVQSAISSRFAPDFSLRELYHKYVAGKPGARLDGDRAVWTLESGNKAALTNNGMVAVTSTKKLSEEGQAKALESDLSSIFLNLAHMVDGYRSSEIHKDVEFDSAYYGHEAGILHRFIVRERTDLTRRNWKLQKNNNVFRYAKISLIIDGSWAKLSLGESYVVSFGRWTSRDSTSALTPNEDSAAVKITPYGWLRWYVAAIDVVTEPTLNPPKITGWGSYMVEYRSNELIDHLQASLNGGGEKRRAEKRVYKFNYP